MLFRSVGDRFDEPELEFNLSENMHVENMEENISITWQRICNCDQVTVPITQIWNNEPMDQVRVFVSSLFLAKMKKITLSQRRLPYGGIMIKNIAAIEPPVEMTLDITLPDTPDVLMAEPQTATEGESISLEELAVV